MNTLTKPRYHFDSQEHCHTLDGKPLIGTTTALGIFDKGGLVPWACKMMAEATIKEVNKRIDDQADEGLVHGQIEEICARTENAWKEKRDSAKDSGIDLHTLLSKWINFRMCTPGHTTDFDIRPILSFVKWEETHVKRFLFTELHCYSEILWCGGIADFGFEDQEGNYVLGDFKSSEKPYFSHYLQCGGYAEQIGENGGFKAIKHPTMNSPIAEYEKVFTLDKPFSKYAIFCVRGGLDKPFFTSKTQELQQAFGYAIELYRSKLWFERDKEFNDN